jgi:hypothetical protein
MINHALKANKSGANERIKYSQKAKIVFPYNVKQIMHGAVWLFGVFCVLDDGDDDGGRRKTLKIYNLNLFEAKFSNQILIRKAKLRSLRLWRGELETRS